jgi:hypothetical protein
MNTHIINLFFKLIDPAGGIIFGFDLFVSFLIIFSLNE